LKEGSALRSRNWQAFDDRRRKNERGRGEPMKDNVTMSLSLEVEQIENRTKPGCQNSSSTNPLCTCPIPAIKQ
jgi:hypothetical protein